MKRFLINSTVIALLSCMSLPNAFGHALHLSVGQGEAVTLSARYDDGEAMQYAEIKIYAPGSDSIEFQNGRTDAKGRFAFIPSREGTWRVKISDGMGHLKTTTVKVDRGLRAGDIKNSGLTWMQKIIMVLIVSWGAMGTTLYFRHRNRQ